MVLIRYLSGNQLDCTRDNLKPLLDKG